MQGRVVELTDNLEFHGLAFELDSSDLEINTDSRNVTFCVGIVGESKEETRFPYTRITDEEKL